MCEDVRVCNVVVIAGICTGSTHSKPLSELSPGNRATRGPLVAFDNYCCVHKACIVSAIRLVCVFGLRDAFNRAANDALFAATARTIAGMILASALNPPWSLRRSSQRAQTWSHPFREIANYHDLLARG